MYLALLNHFPLHTRWSKSISFCYGALIAASTSDLLVDTPRRCEASLLLNIRPNILCICMNRNIRTTATNVQTIIRCKLQHCFLELPWLFPLLPPVCTSIPEEDAVGGRLKLPAPLLGIVLLDRLVFLRCSPCSSLGGRRACRELILLSI